MSEEVVNKSAEELDALLACRRALERMNKWRDARKFYWISEGGKTSTFHDQ